MSIKISDLVAIILLILGVMVLISMLGQISQIIFKDAMTLTQAVINGIVFIIIFAIAWCGLLAVWTLWDKIKDIVIYED